MLTVRLDERLIVLDFGQRERERRNFSFEKMRRLQYLLESRRRTAWMTALR
jgi:hypothetical protein